jgi:hypothetical protein
MHLQDDLRKHHQIASFLIGKLLRAIPLSPYPLLIKEQLEVVIGHRSGREGPWTFETGAIRVAATKGVGAGESNNFLVIESGEPRIR